MKKNDGPLASRGVEQLILEVRGQKVLLDEDLAELYGVATKALNQAVSRNGDRFPEDFAFRLTRAEGTNLKSQTVTSRSEGHGGRRKLPRVFTEEGVAMLSSVLRNKQAVAVNIAIMRAFCGSGTSSSATRPCSAGSTPWRLESAPMTTTSGRSSRPSASSSRARPSLNAGGSASTKTEAPGVTGPAGRADRRHVLSRPVADLRH